MPPPPAPPAQTPCSYVMAGGAGAFMVQASEAELGEAGYTPDAIGAYEAVLEVSRSAREEVARWDAGEVVTDRAAPPTPPSAVTRAIDGCRLTPLTAGPFAEGDPLSAATSAWALVPGRDLEPGSAAWNLAEAQERQLFDAVGNRLPDGLPAPPEGLDACEGAWREALVNGGGVLPEGLRNAPASCDLAAVAGRVDETTLPFGALRDEARAARERCAERVEALASARAAEHLDGLARACEERRFPRTVERLEAEVRSTARRAEAARRSATVPRGRADMMARAYERSVSAGVPDDELRRRLQRRVDQEEAARCSARTLRAQSGERDLDRARASVAQAEALRARVTGRAGPPAPTVPTRPPRHARDADVARVEAEPLPPPPRAGRR